MFCSTLIMLIYMQRYYKLSYLPNESSSFGLDLLRDTHWTDE